MEIKGFKMYSLATKRKQHKKQAYKMNTKLNT